MAVSTPRSPSKRLYILSNEDIEALYGRPHFSPDEQQHYFRLTHEETAVVQSFRSHDIQLYCWLQLGYFKAKRLFFAFDFVDVSADCSYIWNTFFARDPMPLLHPLNKRTILKQRAAILDLFGYRFCTASDRADLLNHAQRAARRSSKPLYLFRDILNVLHEWRIVLPGYTVLQEAIIGKALTFEETRLATVLQTHLSLHEQNAFDHLFEQTDGLYPITLLRRQPRDVTLKEIREEVARSVRIKPLYQTALALLDRLDISHEAITYYASYIGYYSVFRLLQYDRWTRYLYTLCFLVHRYQRLNDNLINSFLHHVKHLIDEARISAKEQLAAERLHHQQTLSKAGEVLKLMAASYPPETAFVDVQAQAFNVLDSQQLHWIADYMIDEGTISEYALQWEYLERQARRFKPYLRPLLRTLDLTAPMRWTPLLEALHVLKETFRQERPLRPHDLPTACIPERDHRLLVAATPHGHAALIPDRYEFLIYRLLREALEAGHIFCHDSLRFRSFDQDLIAVQEWQEHKAIFLAQTELPRLALPIQQHLDTLEHLLEERLATVNARLANGENTSFQQRRGGSQQRWSLHTSKQREGINHRLFDLFPHISLRTVLHEVQHHCGFMDAFDHVLGRYRKQDADSDRISACLIAWATNMGLGRMGAISDISYDYLHQTSTAFLRPETLKAANDCVNNATAALDIFHEYDLGHLLHTSSDGQKFETAISTFQSRYAPKYFGLGKGIVADTLIANHLPINAELISAHDHESHYVLDLLLNNTTDLHPVIHSTDTHGTNHINFALLYFFNYQFAPRYRDLYDKVRTSLYGFHHPRQYESYLLTPIRKINRDLIIDEWDAILRILVSLAQKTTSQHIIVGKLNAYARRNKTRQALCELDNILRSLYLLDYIDSADIRSNVQHALNRGESYHHLRRAVSYANFGKLRFRTEEDQHLWHACSQLVTSCILFYNTFILSRLWAYKHAHGDSSGAALIARVSPTAWQHINFYGRYEFSQDVESLNLDGLIETLAQCPVDVVYADD